MKRQGSSELALIEKHKHHLSSAKHLAQASPDPIFDNRVAFSVSEAAFLLGVSVRTVERLVQRNDLKVRRAGRRILIPKDELGAWLNRKE